MNPFTIIDNIMYCTLNSFTSIGIDLNTIRQGYKRGAFHWQSIKDPNDRRKRLIAFEPMKDKYKAMVIATYGDPYEYLQHQALDYKNDILQQISNTLSVDCTHYNYFQKFCTKKKAYTYAKVCAWLELILSIKGADCKGWGFNGKSEFLEALGNFLKGHQLPISLSSKPIIHRQVRKYKKAKEESEEAALNTVLDGRSGNQNRRKIYEEQGKYLITLMSSPSKPPITTVTNLYNRKAREMGWEEITSRAADLYLNKAENISRWYLRRQGKKATYDHLEISTGRDRASAPDVLWMMDGTPIDLYYKSKAQRYNRVKEKWEWTETKWNRINMFCILDAFSWKIIGYYLSERENHVAVIEALRNSVRNTMSLPMQIMYDRSSANKKVNSVLKELAKYNTPNKPYRAKPKSLEPMFGHFQQEQLRYNDNWGGQNITAKSQDSRVNPEYLKKAMDNLPTLAELEKNIELMVELWNERATEKRQRPNALYKSKKTKGKAIDWMTFSNLFFVVTAKEYKYHNHGGIGITITGEKYNFQTWDQDVYYNQLVGQKFQIAYDPDTMDYIYLYKDNKPFLDENNQPVLIPRLENLPMAIGDYKGDDSKRVEQYINAQNKGTNMLNEWAREAEEEAANLGAVLTPEFVYKEAYNRAEENIKRTQHRDETGGDGNWEELYENPY